MVAARPIEAVQAVTLDDIKDIVDLTPEGVDPNSGWICFAHIGDHAIVAYDFRRNRLRAQQTLARAEEFAQIARLGSDQNLVASAIENAYAAAELAVTSHMLLRPVDVVRKHDEKRKWFKDYTELDNAPSSHGRTLAWLAQQRRPARYAERTVKVSTGHLESTIATVTEMIADAKDRAADARSSA